MLANVELRFVDLTGADSRGANRCAVRLAHPCTKVLHLCSFPIPSPYFYSFPFFVSIPTSSYSLYPPSFDKFPLTAPIHSFPAYPCPPLDNRPSPVLTEVYCAALRRVGYDRPPPVLLLIHTEVGLWSRWECWIEFRKAV